MSPSDTERETMEIAALEIARMSEEIDGLRAELVAEQQRRLEAEAHLETMSDRVIEIEAEIREECYAEMEKQMETEMRRWKATWADEADRNDEHLDRKLEIYTRSIDASEENKENFGPPQSVVARNEDLEAENERLRRELELARRENRTRSPSKAPRMPLRETSLRPARDMEMELGVETEMERMNINSDGPRKESSGTRSPVKKMKKLGTRKWDLLDEGEML